MRALYIQTPQDEPVQLINAGCDIADAFEISREPFWLKSGGKYGEPIVVWHDADGFKTGARFNGRAYKLLHGHLGGMFGSVLITSADHNGQPVDITDRALRVIALHGIHPLEEA